MKKDNENLCAPSSILGGMIVFNHLKIKYTYENNTLFEQLQYLGYAK